MATFNLSVVTPDGIAFDDNAESLVAPGMNGYFGILANHAPMIAAVVPGEFKITTDHDQYFAVGSGVLEVNANTVCFLSDHVDKADSCEQAKKIAAEYPRA